MQFYIQIKKSTTETDYNQIHSLCAVLLPEVLVLLFGDLLDHVERLTHQLLLDDLEQFVLLEGLTRYVQGQVVRINDALHEGQVLGHHVGKVVGDEHPSHVHLDKVHLLSVALEHVARRALGHEEDRPEGDFTLSREMGMGDRVI